MAHLASRTVTILAITKVNLVSNFLKKKEFICVFSSKFLEAVGNYKTDFKGQEFLKILMLLKGKNF